MSLFHLKRILLFAGMLFFGTKLTAQALITDFYPASGPVGTNVFINGFNFDSAPANNIVYFGAVRATVIVAALNGIIVAAPAGATYQPITVTINSLVASTSKPFIPTFTSFATFDATSFDPRQDFTSPSYSRSISAGDIDGDRKPDLVNTCTVPTGGFSSLNIRRNTSVQGTISFGTPVSVSPQVASSVEKLADLDGDGKLDIIANGPGQVIVLINTSTPGNIQFSAAVGFTVGTNPQGIDVADFDHDGRPDIVAVNQGSNTISVLRNSGSPGILSFANRVNFTTGQNPFGGRAADLNADGKPEMVVANRDDNTVSVFNNTCTPGTISFTRTDFPTGTTPFTVAIGDLDNDDKKEILAINNASNSFSVLRNTSATGSISFLPKVDFTTGMAPVNINLADMNGDAKADVVVSNFLGGSLSVYKNQSVTGTISFAPKFDYALMASPWVNAAVDLDGDGRTDMASANGPQSNMAVFRNAAQILACPGAINTFPYNEKFETSDGGWIAGGTSSDWAWGIPTKPVINAAGEGNRCWITGGLTNASYNNAERSWLQSPCFDFTTLTHPQISFKVFWETEKKFDGASLQYSIDGGASWLYLGAANTDDGCATQNWFNNPNITYLSGNGGWSGNKQTSGGSCQVGNGSITWVLAKHDMTLLAGKPSVLFRYEFGAGTTCNSFDGFAIDDVKIYEALPSVAEFSYTCKPALTVDFTGEAVCPTGESWTFGDPASGANNTSTNPNPTHIFSAPGTYIVAHQATFPSNGSNVIKSVTVLGGTTALTQGITCGGTSTAIITATGAGSSNPYTYIWNTTPPQFTAAATGLPAGTYTVTINSGTACPAQSTITVTEPPALGVTGTTQPAVCLASNGSVTTTVSGGTMPYSYVWSTGSANPSLTNVAAGLYHVDVSDANGCIAPADFTVDHLQKNLPVNLGADAFICPGEKLVLDAGNYDSYLWQDNSTDQTFTVTQTGNYSVVVSDINGCTGTDAIRVVVDCSDIYFPDAFTPNGDGRNELFGPAGTNLGAVKNYSFDVYNRFGELVFHSIDPYKKWDGKLHGKIIEGAYVWMSSYSLNGKNFNKKGSVLLIR